MDNGKIDRVLDIYTKLMSGALVNKAEEAQNYGVNERSIQRLTSSGWKNWGSGTLSVGSDNVSASLTSSIYLYKFV